MTREEVIHKYLNQALGTLRVPPLVTGQVRKAMEDLHDAVAGSGSEKQPEPQPSPKPKKAEVEKVAEADHQKPAKSAKNVKSTSGDNQASVLAKLKEAAKEGKSKD